MRGLTRAARAAELTRLRAAVLGAEDGIVSIAGLLTGIAATPATATTILGVGVAGTVAGAVSMAAGEYISVAAQRDSEQQLVAAGQMFRDELARPWHAAVASGLAFLAGAVLPMLAAALAPPTARVEIIAAAVITALAVAGTTSAHLASTPIVRPTARTVAGGALALAVTYLVGRLTGATGL